MVCRVLYYYNYIGAFWLHWFKSVSFIETPPVLRLKRDPSCKEVLSDVDAELSYKALGEGLKQQGRS